MPSDPDILSPALKTTPYWWEGAPPPPPDTNPLPHRVDVVVIGSGYTGLNAALGTARGGRETLVLDAQAPGWGCSSRNGGQISTCIKPDAEALARRYGRDRAAAILAEGRASLAHMGRLVAEEGIDCDFAVRGRFLGAHTPQAFSAMARRAADDPDCIVVPRAEQHREILTDRYHGGMVQPHHAQIDPARYHAGLLARARAAGARVVGDTAVTALARDGDAWRLETARGPVRARDVVVATNGYTGALTPWLRRRVIPIGSQMIATEPLPEGLMARLLPTGRTVADSRRVVYYYRASPDGRRMIFGGRVSAGAVSPEVAARRLHAEMARLFPDLAAARVSHSWMGFVAYTFDTLPHLGGEDGLHHAMGYCGSGVGMSSLLGMRLGQRVLGAPEGASPLEGIGFPTRPLYSGRPWFLPAAVAWYRLCDRLGI